jgi:excisionase family DNA binding protein
MEELLTITQVGNLTNIKTATLRKFVAQREIPFVKLGRLVRFVPSEIEQWVKERKVAEQKRKEKKSGGKQKEVLFS